MSDTPTPVEKTEKPPVETPVEKVVATEKPPEETKVVEPPFTVDVLQACTSRFSRKAWDLFLAYKKDMGKIRTVPIRAQLTAKTPAGAQELAAILKDKGGVSQLTLTGNAIECTATFEAIQHVIKLPQTQSLEAVKI